MSRNNWSVLDNGDSEGDAEPDITCAGCGEDGYNIVNDLLNPEVPDATP